MAPTEQADLTAWLEQQWNKANEQSDHPDKDTSGYTFYDGLTTAYEFAINHVRRMRPRTAAESDNATPYGKERTVPNLKELTDIGCVYTMVDKDGIMYPCGKPVAAIRHWPDYGDGENYGGVCQRHAQRDGIDLVPLRDIPNPFSWPSYLTYVDLDDEDPSDQPRIGDYGWAIRETASGQDEIPFHIEREGHTGLPVAVLNTGLDAKPEDDIEEGQYVSLLQLCIDGFELTRTGRK